MSDLRERLADLEHERWSGWMRWMFQQGVFNADGTWTMPAEKVERWQRQMNTPYADLTEREKDSDRAEVDKTLAVLGNRSPILYVREGALPTINVDDLCESEET